MKYMLIALTLLCVGACGKGTSFSDNEGEVYVYSAFLEFNESDRLNLVSDLNDSLNISGVEPVFRFIGNGERVLFKWDDSDSRVFGRLAFDRHKLQFGYALHGSVDKERIAEAVIKSRIAIEALSDRVNIGLKSEYIKGGCKAYPEFFLSEQCFAS